jgi:hypothetical protein
VYSEAMVAVSASSRWRVCSVSPSAVSCENSWERTGSGASTESSPPSVREDSYRPTELGVTEAAGSGRTELEGSTTVLAPTSIACSSASGSASGPGTSSASARGEISALRHTSSAVSRAAPSSTSAPAARRLTRSAPA